MPIRNKGVAYERYLDLKQPQARRGDAAEGRSTQLPARRA
ncbi:MAG: hypothetical protein JWO75_2871, partial [Actinomycetia bacterium]|nr:hypothetical protein [Actinomycetes bacterium]